MLLPDLSFGLFGKAFGFFGQLLVAPLTYLVARFVLNVKRFLDELPPIVKRVVVFVIAIAIAGLYQYLGQPLPAECSAVATGDVPDACFAVLATPAVLRAVVAAFVAYFMHALKKADPRT